MGDKLKEIFLNLLKIKSVTGNEEKLAEYIKEELADTVFAADLQEYKQALIYSSKTCENKKTILLAGHMDTVSGDIPVREEGDIIYGRGTCDMKAGIAVMMFLAKNLEVEKLPYNLKFLFYPREEGDFIENGMKQVFEETKYLDGIDFGILLEPTSNQIALGCNGSTHTFVKIKGEAGHSARPWNAKNAIYKSLSLIEKIKEIDAKKHIISDLEFIEVVNVTQINTTCAKNMIPGECHLNINHRFPPSMTVEESFKKIESLLPNDCESEKRDFVPSGKIIDSDILEEFKKISNLKLVPKQGYTDVGLLTQAGISSVNFGPGDQNLCHKADEKIDFKELEFSYGLLLKLLQNS